MGKEEASAAANALKVFFEVLLQQVDGTAH